MSVVRVVRCMIESDAPYVPCKFYIKAPKYCTVINILDESNTVYVDVLAIGDAECTKKIELYIAEKENELPEEVYLEYKFFGMLKLGERKYYAFIDMKYAG